MIVYSSPEDALSIPLIDLHPSFSSNQTDVVKVAEEIGAACRDMGFFYVTNHGVDSALIAAAFEAANRFFDQPLATKMDVRKRVDSNGYEPAGLQRLDNGSPGDLKESFNYSHGVYMDEHRALDNRWPRELSGFREALDAYYAELATLAMHLTRLIARSLQLPADYFDRAMERPGATLRLLRYPPHPQHTEFNQLGAGAHTDWGWLTLLAQDDSGGLEVQATSGVWLRARPIPGTFVVNLGDLVARWTNDRYRSTMHRVLNNQAGRNRHSVVFFNEPAFSTVVECLPTCRTGDERANYAPCTAGEHRMQKYLQAVRHLEPDR